ncbi:MAG: hypothetical protein K2N41_03695 [Lachnospiraceae bacterium]|nr:hypothetical protein [Lachnospiraceae bacterium]MDE7238798.1 hypothetical protein [Lachnospiraceae bacterium]
MNILRTSSEEEMISEYLRAEYHSERFSEHIKKAMKALSLDESILLCADLNNTNENTARKKLLGEFRGYGLNRELFENFPNEIQWSLCNFVSDDFGNIRYINYSYWNELSKGTHSPLIAAQTIQNGIEIYHQSNAGFVKAAEFIKSGGKFARPILLTSDLERFVIVEGHFRITAFALVPEHFHNVECFVGKCSSDDLKKWM